MTLICSFFAVYYYFKYKLKVKHIIVLTRVKRDWNTCHVFNAVCAPIREIHPLALSCLLLEVKEIPKCWVVPRTVVEGKSSNGYIIFW